MSAPVMLGATPGVDIAAAVSAYEEARRTARQHLLAAVQADPAAAWIVEHAMPAYHAQGLAVLQALPATMAQLDDLADREDWCDTWADQVAAARVAGVIPDSDIEAALADLLASAPEVTA